MKAAAQAQMDQFGVLDRLIYGKAAPGNAESICRLLGMVHLYRASGVHLLAFFTFLNGVVFWTSKRLGLKVEKSKFLGIALTGLTIYWIWSLQDFRITLIRPILTFIIRLYFKEKGATARIAIPLALTYICECLLSSESSWSEGALHYYFSVAGGLFAYHLKPDLPSWKRHLNLAVGSWLPIALISLVRDHEVSYLTPFYSLVSLPIITFFLYPLTLVDVFIHQSVSPEVVYLWQLFLNALFFCADLGASFSVVSKQAVWTALPLALIFGFYRKRIPQYFSVLLLVLLSSMTLARASVDHESASKEVIQLDVHQGDAAILKDKSGRTEMVDVGSLRTYAPDTWVLKLAHHDVDEVDAILLSHLDEDHCGALKELLLLMPVSCIETNQALWRSEKGIRLSTWIKQFAPKTRIESQGCMELPKIAWFKSKHSGSGGNELMAGLVFRLNSHVAYFALGDGDEEQELLYEKQFDSELNRYPDRIWKISHHGSRFSSNFSFLKRMDAREYWISVGRHNPYHHPNPLTLMKLSYLQGKVYRTDEVGDVSRSFSE
jgi:competence protein ComEC